MDWRAGVRHAVARWASHLLGRQQGRDRGRYMRERAGPAPMAPRPRGHMWCMSCSPSRWSSCRASSRRTPSRRPSSCTSQAAHMMRYQCTGPKRCPKTDQRYLALRAAVRAAIERVRCNRVKAGHARYARDLRHYWVSHVQIRRLAFECTWSVRPSGLSPGTAREGASHM